MILASAETAHIVYYGDILFMKKTLAHLFITFLIMNCLACTACTKEKPQTPAPKPPLPYKINLVWQHDHKPEVDLSALDKVPGVNVVSPCWYVIDNEFGKLQDKSIEGYVELAHAKGYQVWPLITNGFKPDRTKKLLDDENARKYVIEQLRQQYQKHKFDGINLDFEHIYEADKDRITEFVKQIRKATQQDKLILSMDVTVPKGSPNWSLCFDRKALAEHLDYMMVMAYDQYSGASPEAGPTAGYDWVERGIKNTLEEVPAHKLVLGIPLYMRLWHYDKDKKRFFAKTLNMPGAEKIMSEKANDETFRCRWLDKEKVTYVSYMENDVPYSFWQENITSLEHKASLVKTYGLGGVASWRYGFEKPEIWPMLEEKLKEEKSDKENKTKSGNDIKNETINK